MGLWIRGWLAGCLAVVVMAVLVLGVMAGLAPAPAASALSRESGGRPAADAAALAAVPASLRAAIRRSLGPSVSAAVYSRRAELTVSGGASSDAFGSSVALSAGGSTALVGTPGRPGGAAYVFTLRGGTWSQTAELTGSDAARGDEFGWSVALSAGGTTALVGAIEHNSGTGAAYVFRLRGGAWSQVAVLAASHAGRGDAFGYSVALSAWGSTALVGTGNADGGAAYVFRLRGGAWSQVAELTASHAGYLFGSAVALAAQGSTALVSAPFRRSAAGAVYVFRLRGGKWSQAAVLAAAHGAAGDLFGSSVALSAGGGTALVGASGVSSDGGAAYVFRLRGGAWSQVAVLAASHVARGVAFGAAVALSPAGSTALIGAGSGPVRGVAYVFRLRGSTWPEVAELTASDGASFDGFGSSVALSASGSTALVGAPNHPAAGAAYVFTAAGRA